MTGSVQVPTSAATVVMATVVAWLGFLIHNIADLPRPAVLGAETVMPTVVFLVLAVAWWWPGPRFAAWPLYAWGWLNAIGGGLLSVLPLPQLPFQPEQSLRHYAFHGLYLASQLPLLIVLTRHLRSRTSHSGSPVIR